MPESSNRDIPDLHDMSEGSVHEGSRALGYPNDIVADLRVLRIVESIADAVLMIDPSDTIRYLNPEAVRLTGKHSNELVGTHPWDTCPELPGLPDLEIVRRVRQEHGKARYESYHAFVQRWFDFNVVWTPEGIAVYFRDITRLKRAEEEARNSERELHDLLENAPDIVARYDRDLCHTYINPIVEGATGLARESFIGKTNRGAGLPEEVCEAWDAALKRVFETGEEQRIPVNYETPFGIRHFDTRMVPEHGEDGIRSVLAISRDLTDRWQVEEGIRRHNEELEERVEARTVELLAANSELERFSYTVAHDLRTPLRTIASTSHMLLEDCKDRLCEEECEHLRRQAAAATRLGHLIDDLLQFSRLSKGGLSRVKFDLSLLVEEVALEVSSLKPSGMARILIDPRMRIYADPQLMRLVIQNLLENALKFLHPDQPGTIRIGRTERGHAPLFFVEDDGMGFDPIYAERIFEPFERLNGNEIGGTGVGLANVRRIVERHGGRVWAESNTSHGATFFFTIPDQS